MRLWFAHDLIRKPVPTFRDHALPHHARDAARPPLRAGDPGLQIAVGRRPDVTLPQVGPGPALAVGFAGAPTAAAGVVRGKLELLVVRARTVDREFDRADVRLDDASAAHARHAAGRGRPRRDPGLEPTDRLRALGR